MSLIRITNPNELRGVHIVLLGLLVIGAVGACLLTSPDKPTVLHDGAREWDPDSLTLALVELLALQYAAPTSAGVAVKGLAHGLVAGIGLFVAVAGLVAWSRSETRDEADTVIDVERVAGGEQETAGIARRQLNPIRTAQALLLAFVGWSFASTTWSQAPEYAWGGAVLLASQIVWAYALGFGLNRRAATYGGHALLIILVATAAMAIAYRGERNPTLRASYPVGNPIMLASCLLPGVLVAIMTAASGVSDVLRRRVGRGVAKVALCAVALAILAFATYLTRSRGPYLGLVVALAGLVYFAGNRRVRQVTAAITLVGIVAAGAYFYSQRAAYSTTGRSDSMRVRLHSWGYALDLFQQAPVRGLGQGGYALQADALAAQDVLDDPAALEARIVHAHSEWLETAADLGSVGVVLLVAALLVTLHGGAKAAAHIPSRAQRCMLIALLAALVGLMVAETTGVGLRIVGLPMVFYTVVGLIWALAGPPPTAALRVMANHRALGITAAIAALVAGFFIVEISRRDFAAARAAYQVDAALRQQDWQRAEALAAQAFRNRLSPYRKLMTAQVQIGTDGQLAQVFQEQYLRRRALAEQGGRIDPNLAAQAEESLQRCQEHIEAGRTRLRDMLAAAPSPYHYGDLEYGFLQLLAYFARLNNDADQLAEFHEQAAAALQLELARRPFNSELAARYVLAQLTQLDPEELITVLARPLRIHLVSSVYQDLLLRIAQTDSFRAAIEPTVQAIRNATPHDDPAQWASPWAPEILRLGAMTATGAQRSDAVAYLEEARSYYDRIAPRALLARAVCLAELAEARFLAAPEDPAAAIAPAEEALKEAPNSEDGRALVATMRNRLIAYHLAAGHEDFARKIIRDRALGLTDDELATYLANAYVDMAYQLFTRMLQRDPEQVEAWSRRALELAPGAAPVWFLAADLALFRQNEQKALYCINEVLARHNDLEDVQELCNRATRAMPNSTPLRQLAERVAALMQQGGNTPPPPPADYAPPSPALPSDRNWTPPDVAPPDLGTPGAAQSTTTQPT